MIEDELIQNEKNKELVYQVLFQRGITEEIISHIRYESILCNVSNIMRKLKLKTNDEKIKFINSIVINQNNGDLIIIEGEGPESSIITSEYFFDDQENKLKRIRIETKQGGEKSCTNISTYNEDGIEETLSTEQRVGNITYMSNAIRLPNRIDVILLKRMIINSNTGDIEKIKDLYQIRTFFAALEEINPGIDDVDPFNIMNYSILGMPQIYRNLTPEENLNLKNSHGQILSLGEEDRRKQLKEYKDTNIFYKRTKVFEKGIEKYLVIKDNYRETE